MSRHRGRSRPFTARRRYFPAHCGCHRSVCPWGQYDMSYGSFWDAHVVWTVAPR